MRRVLKVAELCSSGDSTESVEGERGSNRLYEEKWKILICYFEGVLRMIQKQPNAVILDF